MASNILTWLREDREKLQLVGYFVVILTFSIPVTRMIGEGYRQAGLVQAVLRLRLLFEINLDQVALAMFGVYLGLLTLMTIDHKKRVQAVLLWIATLVATVALATMGLFLPNVEPLQNLPWLAGGLVAGLILGGGKQLLEFDTVQTTEFRRASEGVYFLLAIVALVSFLEVHLLYPEDVLRVTPSTDPPIVFQLFHENPTYGIEMEGIVVDAIATGVFIGVVNRFITYDADQDFFLLGPRASGKSLFLIGAYLEALDRTRSDEKATPLNPSEDLMSMIEELDREDTGWIVEATGRGVINELRFQYVHGSVFPTNVQLSSIDYAGEYLERLPDAVSGATDDDEMDTTLRRLTENIESADTLLLIIDVERFMNGEPLEISEYFSILQAADDKNAVLVATKADHLADEFEETEGLEPHLYFDEFVEFVNQRLRQNENVNSLVTQVGGEQIHPVYYQTKEDEQGNMVPRRDASGSVLTVGFDEFLDKLGRY